MRAEDGILYEWTVAPYMDKDNWKLHPIGGFEHLSIEGIAGDDVIDQSQRMTRCHGNHKIAALIQWRDVTLLSMKSEQQRILEVIFQAN